MKTICLVFLFFLFAFSLLAQDEECSTVVPDYITLEDMKPYGSNENLAFFKRTTMTPPLRLYIHVIFYADGSGGITPSEINQAVNRLNNDFQQVNMQFFIFNIDSIFNDVYAHMSTREQSAELRSSYNKPYCINVYFVPEFYSGGESFFPQDSVQGIVIKNNVANTSTFAHEMGHYFNLLHTFSTKFGVEQIPRKPHPCENCENAGDLLCDTEADPNLGEKAKYEEKVNFNCDWTATDHLSCNDTTYYYDPPTQNIMSYYPENCRTEFTLQQGERMEHALQYYYSFLLQGIVELHQRLSNGQSAGLVGVWENEWWDYSVPHFLELEGENTKYFRADSNVILNEKFFLWRDQQSHPLTYLIYNEFSNIGDKIFISQFKPIYNARLAIKLISGETGGFVEFSDPWLRDTVISPYGSRNRGVEAIFHEFDSPFDIKTDSIYQGVFLNQNETFDPNKPIYSVRAPSQQSLPFRDDEAPANFLNWDGHPDSVTFQSPNQTETAVVFKLDGAVARAVYKSPLVVSNASAIAHNNQRKLFYDGSTYHLVYEEQGNIYYTYSTDNGQLWSKEKLLGSGKAPAFASSVSGFKRAVVWQDGANIMLDYYDGGWMGSASIYTMLTGSPGDATPVIAYLNGYFYIIWRDFTSGDENLKIVSFDPTEGSVGMAVAVPNTNANSVNPTLASDYYNRLHLAWEENGKIYYSQINPSGEQISFTVNKENVSDGTAYSNHQYPCITTDGSRRPNIMWRAYDDGGGIIDPLYIVIHARRSGSWPNEWSYYAFRGNDDYYPPSIVGFAGMGAGWDTLRATWRRTYDYIFKGNYDGNNWHVNFTGEIGQNPMLSANPSTAPQSGYVFRKYSSMPYLLKPISETITTNALVSDGGQTTNAFQTLNKMQSTNTGNISTLSEEVSIIRYRRGVLRMGNAALVFELGEMTVDGQNIALYRYPDSLIVGKDRPWQALFRSEVFDISSGSRLRYSMAFKTLNAEALMANINAYKGLGFRVELVDASSEKVLSVADTRLIKDQVPVNFKGWKEVFFQLSGNHKVYLRISLDIPAQLSIKQSLVEVLYLKDNGEQQLAKGNEEKPVPVQRIPKVYQLYQNYPNPFNPITTIRFDLPKATDIQLVVYDIAGRRIATLMNGYVSAGEHRVVWDGRDDTGNRVASGVYIYRLQSGEFVASRKMLLVR